MSSLFFTFSSCHLLKCHLFFALIQTQNNCLPQLAYANKNSVKRRDCFSFSSPTMQNIMTTKHEQNMCVLCLFVHLAAFIYYCCCYCFRQHYWLIGRVNWIICLKLIAPMLVMYLDFAKFWCFFDQLSIATILFPLEKGACHVHFCLSKHFSIVDEFRIQYEVDSNWTQKHTLNSLLLKPDIPNNTDDEITFGRRHKTLPTSMREKWKVKTRAIWQIAYVLHFFVYVEKKTSVYFT